MAPTTFSLIELKSSASNDQFIGIVQKLPPNDRPVYVGRCQHWVHAPRLSKDALTGTGKVMKKWDYLIINKATDAHSFTIPDGLASSIADSWSLTTEIPDEQLGSTKATNEKLLATPVSDLPKGWSPSDHSGLDASDPPADLEASLALASHSLGSSKDSNPTDLKQFTRTLGPKHTGPVNMFNLLSFMPGQVGTYMQYIEAFQASIGIKYGGQPYFFSFEGPDWSSKDQEELQEGGWEAAALVWYPSIWHFSKMFDDPEYADVDRRFKQGALRDNPLLCCTEVETEGAD